jgi:signal transduction histidine kinase
MSEIIWAMNSKNDTLENLIAYVREYASAYFEPFNLKLMIEIPETIPHHVINSNIRRTVFLVVKESLHNIIKHADANLVKVKVTMQGNLLAIEIKDDGKGFDINDARRFGNGLDNIKKRMSEIKADYQIKSEPGTGTTINLSVPV